MDILEHEVHSLDNTLKGLSFKYSEAKVFLQEEVKSEQVLYVCMCIIFT